MSKIYLGIDIGGTKIKAILLEEESLNSPFSLIAKKDFFLIDTPRNKKDFLNGLARFIDSIFKNKIISGIGVGLPGIVDSEKNILIKAPNLPFLKNWELQDFLKKWSGNIKTDNDSRCFLRAEAICGAGIGFKNIIGIARGTGIGGGIMIEGKIYRGLNNRAGEFGHTIIDNKKTFEEVAGKAAFINFGDKSDFIGIGVANLINIFDPELVILGGGGITCGAVKMDIVKNTAKKYIISQPVKKTKIVKTKLGDKAGSIGAAALFLDY